MQTRPDGLYAASKLMSFCQALGAKHYGAALRLLGYLYATRKMGITYGGQLRLPAGLPRFPDRFHESYGMHTYTDSSWGREPRPFGGHVTMLNNGAVNWKGGRLGSVPDSTCEAETTWASKGAKSTVGVRNTLIGLDRPVAGPTPLIGDNQAARDLILKDGISTLTRHFERRALIIKHLYATLVITPLLVSTKEMAADLFTKALDPATFFKHRDYILNLQSSPRAPVVLSGYSAWAWKHVLKAATRGGL